MCTNTGKCTHLSVLVVIVTYEYTRVSIKDIIYKYNLYTATYLEIYFFIIYYDSIIKTFSMDSIQ